MSRKIENGQLIIEDSMALINYHGTDATRLNPQLLADGEIAVVHNGDNTNIYTKKAKGIDGAEVIKFVNEKELAAEAAERDRVDDLLDGLIKAEENRAKAAEQTLTNDLAGEVTRATAAEQTLTQNLAAEETARIAADNTLQSNIDAEKARAEAAEATLQANIDSEKARAEQAETTLQTNINTEKARAEAEEQTLTTNLAAEVTRATEAEEELQNKINEVSGAAKSYSVVKCDADELATLGTNVREAYKLVDEDDVKAGEVIKIYKDSSLKEVKLVNEDLAFTYILADGTETTVNVSIESFLAESEFKNGLVVANNEVSVKIDEASEAFLTVSADGVKLSGVQTAIDNAVKVERERAQGVEGEIQVELNATQAGAGLAEGGAYVKNAGANYIAEAASLNDADVKLDAALKSEAEVRIAADNTLQGNIDAEAEARTNADSALTQSLAAEQEARIAADSALTQSIAAEQEARIAADNAMDTRVKVLEAIDHNTFALKTTVQDIENEIGEKATAVTATTLWDAIAELDAEKVAMDAEVTFSPNETLASIKIEGNKLVVTKQKIVVDGGTF